MTLYDMMRERPELFYRPEHPWYGGEDFMHNFAWNVPATPRGFDSRPTVATLGNSQTVAEIAGCYVASHDDPIWRHWFWTSDFDKHGQRVYCGVGPDERGFEIHRHIHLTERFGVAVWR